MLAGAPAIAEEAAGDAAACAEGTGLDVAARIQARYDGVRDMRARFTQNNTSATFGGQAIMDTATKTGEVQFAKPGRMRWVYGDPEPSVVVSNGETLWIHDVAGKAVTRLSVTAGFLSGAAVQFLLGDGDLVASFDIEATRCDPDRVTLDLRPRTDATYERLGLVADPGTGDVLETSVTDLFGNVTRIAFSDRAINLSPPASTFEFDVPEGVELIEYEGVPSP